MNIIFGDPSNTITSHYILLELDTFRRDGDTKTTTAYCLVEKPALDELVNIEAYKKIHADVVKYFKQQHWYYCEQAIHGLMGKWGGELDTFYADLLDRVKQHKQDGVSDNWDATLIK
jgi:hypothetical protein